MKKYIFTLSLLITSWTDPLSAEVMTYQGRLKESNIPVNANRSFDFELCATETPTGCVPSVDGAKPFQVLNGLFKSTFTLPAVDFSAGPWYLRVKVEGSYLSPVERLTFVPYSAFASSAAFASSSAYSAAAVQKTGDTMAGQLTLAGSTLTVTGGAFSVGGSTLVVLNGNVGIGTTAPDERLDMAGGNITMGPLDSAGGIYFRDGGVYNVGIEATDHNGSSKDGLKLFGGDGISFFASEVNERVRITAGGNVGIGTTTPQFPLTVYGNAADNIINVGDNTAGFGLDGFSTYAGAALYVNNSKVFNVESNGGAVIGSTYMTADAIRNGLIVQGYVGIGTAVPNYALEISSGAGEAGTIMSVSTGATNLFWVAGDGAHSLKFTGDGSGLTGITGAVGTDSSKVLKAGDTMTGGLTLAGSTLTVTGDAFSVGGSTLVVQNGNVGIGTTSPFYKLSINEGSIFTLGTTVEPLVYVGEGLVANSYGYMGWNRAGNYLFLGNAGTANPETLVFNTAGNVGIGIASPGAMLDVAGSGNFTGGVTTLSSGTFKAAGASQFSIETSSGILVQAGRIQAPAIQLTNGAAANYVLASDAAGNAKWVDPGAGGLGDPFVGNEITDAANATLTRSGTGTLIDPYKIGLNLSNSNTWVAAQTFNSGLTGSLSGAASQNVLKTGDTMTGQLTLAGSTLTVTGSEFSVGGSTLVVKNGWLGIGTNAPAASLHVISDNGNVHFASPNSQLIMNLIPQTYSPVIFNNNGDGPLAFSIGNAEQVRINPTTLIGIGTSSPLYRLHVSSAAGETGTLMAVSTGTTNVFWVDGSGANALKFTGDGSGLTNVPADFSSVIGTLGIPDGGTGGTTASGARFNLGALNIAGDSMTGQLTVGNNSTMTVAGSAFSVGGSTLAVKDGNIGIGTPIPSSLLHLVGTKAGQGIVLESSVGNGNPNLTVRANPPAGNASISIDRADTGGIAVLSINSGGVYKWAFKLPDTTSGDAERLDLLTAALTPPVMTFKTSGNVGVGTALPTGLFQVGGGSLTVLANGNVGVGTTAPAFPLNVYGGALGSPTIGMQAGSGNDARLDLIRNTGAGFAGIMLRTGAGDGANKEWYIGERTDQKLHFFRDTALGGVDSIVLDTAGNVGISTGAPQARLDVLAAGSAQTDMAQIWRNSAGTIVSSVSATGVVTAAGKFVGDGSGLTGITAGTASNLAGGVGGQIPYQSAANTTGLVAVGAAGDILQSNAGAAPSWITPASANTAGAIVKRDVSGNFTASTITASGDITAARYQINGSTVLTILPGAGSIAVGVEAGRVNTAGNNTFLGYQAAYNNTGGSFNSIIGAQAGITNTTGGNNSFLGYRAGYTNTTGANNSSLGAYAGYFNLTGAGNSIFGSIAGGFGAGGGNSFSSSTIMGYKAGYSLTTGNDNIFLGWQAGYTVTTGTGNIVIGYDKNTSAPGANSELNIGGLLYGDLSARTIGISTRVPQAALDIVSTGTAANVYAQIWRDGAGVVTASVTSQGRFSGDGSGLAGVTVVNGVYTTAANTFTNISAPVLIKPSGAPGADTKLFDMQATGAGLTNFSVDSEGDVTTNGGLLVLKPGTASSSILTLETDSNANNILELNKYGSTVGGSEAGGTILRTNLSKVAAGALAGPLLLQVGSNNPMYFVTNNTQRMIIQGGGNVGIATASPTGLFQVGGGSLTVMATGLVGIGTTAPAYSLHVKSPSGPVAAITGPQPVLHLIADGTQNPTLGFGINGTAGFVGSIYGEGSDSSLRINVSYNDRVVVANNGNVGISTGAPQARLDVLAAGLAQTDMAQIWRNSAGAIVSSVSATGVMMASKLVGDGSGLTNITPPSDFFNSLTLNSSSFTVRSGSTIHFAADTTGKVGINSFPDSNAGLKIQGTGIYDAGILLGNSGTDWAVTNNTGVLSFIKTSGATFTALTINSAGRVDIPVGGFYVGASTLVVVNANVGIGNSNPLSKLEVSGGSVTIHGSAVEASVLKAGDNGIVISTGGAIQTTGTGHGTVIGNPRGNGAVDLQTFRTAAAEVASAPYSVIGGGYANTASASYAFSGGGYGNLSSGGYSVVGGGLSNQSSNGWTTVAGGSSNIASQNNATVGGGSANTAAGYSATVAGGAGNNVLSSAYAGFVGGGENNISTGAYSTVGGGRVNSSSGAYSAVLGGSGNAAEGAYSAVAGGNLNRAYGAGSAVSGGKLNNAWADYSIVAGGDNNSTNGADSIVAGGNFNSANTTLSAVVGGNYNTASGMASFIGGGGNNQTGLTAWGAAAFGANNASMGNYSFAAGYRSTAAVAGTFTWADSSGDGAVNNTPDQVMFKAKGGFWVSTGTVYTDPALFVDANNRVGIGTAIPTAKLQVGGTPGVDGIRFPDGTLQTTAGVGSANSVANTVDAVVNGDSDGNTSGSVRLQTAGSTKVFISTSGNVGIGTTSPSLLFHNAGPAILANNTTVDPDTYANSVIAGLITDGGLNITAIGGKASNAGANWAIGHNNIDLFFAAGDSTNPDTLQTFMQATWKRNLALVPVSGRVGVGLSAATIPDQKLTVVGNISLTGVLISSGAGNNFFAGNVGIGTVTPSALLDVNGTVRLGQYLVESRDAGGTMSAADFGKTITVNSPSPQAILLPAGTAGTIGAQITFVKLNTGTLTVQASGTDYIADSVVSGSIYNNATTPPYATLTIRLVTTNRWMLVGGEGAWITQ